MSEVYGDTVGIVVHLKLVHVFFVYCNIWWQGDKKQYQGIYNE